MPSITVSANSPSIFVGSTAELEAAYDSLSETESGGTIYVKNDFPTKGVIDLSRGGDGPVHITSEDPDSPIEVGRILVNNVENVKLSNFYVDSTGTTVPSYQGDVDVDDSSNIVFDNITYSSDGSAFFDPREAGSVDGGRLAVIKGSSDITFSNSQASDYWQGFTFTESSGITVENVELEGIQADGIKLREVSDVLLKDNYFHDFADSPSEVVHGDFIQLHSANADTTSSGVTITGNILETGNGASVQGIWLANESYTGQASQLYTGITITDNIIYTASANAIGIGASDGTVIANNTILYNAQAYTVKDTGITSFEPGIRVGEDSVNILVQDNISPRYTGTDSPTATFVGNITLEYDVTDPNYADNHFVNVADGGDIGSEDWQLLDGSAWVGKGAAAAQPGGDRYVTSEPDHDKPPVVQDDPVIQPVVVTIDVTEEQTDGQVGEDGPASAPSSDGNNVSMLPIDSETLLDLDFAAGIVDDLSDYNSDLKSGATSNIINDDGDFSYEIGQDKAVTFNVDNAQLHELQNFGFEMDMRLLDSTDIGRFLHFPRAFEAVIEDDRSVTFSLKTDEGSFSVNSGEPIFDDLVSHNFAVGYDGNTLALSIDGTIFDKTAASGTTSEAVHHGLTIGTVWGNPVRALVDDIFLGRDPLDAGVDTSLEIGDTNVSIDDTSATGEQIGGIPNEISNMVSDPTVPIDPTEAFFAIEFDGDALEDLSMYSSQLKHGDATNIVQNETGQGFQISDDAQITLHKSNEQLHELESFGLRLDIQLLDDQDTGRFLHFPRAFEALIEDDRSITFALRTDEGAFKVNSGEFNFDDLESHSFAVGYDADYSRLTLEIDDQAVDSVVAMGTTSAGVHHGLTIGSVWGDSLNAIVDNVWFGDTPEAVGVDSSAGVIYALNSTSVEVIDDVSSFEADTDIEDDLQLVG